MRRRIVGVFETSTSPPKERHAMIQDNVVKLIQPAEFSDPLTEVLREGARALLAQAVEAEVTAFLSGHADRQVLSGLAPARASQCRLKANPGVMRPARWPARSHSSGGGGVCGDRREHVDGGGSGGGGSCAVHRKPGRTGRLISGT